MSKNSEDFQKMLALQSRALDILAEAMSGFGDPDEMRQKLEAVKVFNAMAKQSNFVISQDTDDIKRTMIAGIEEREQVILDAERAASLRIAESDPAAVSLLEMIREAG